mgnify:CR=1 FL=1
MRASGRWRRSLAAAIPAVEWPIHAPFIEAINKLKVERNAVILAHNYQVPEIFHTVADIVGDSLALAREDRPQLLGPGERTAVGQHAGEPLHDRGSRVRGDAAKPWPMVLTARLVLIVGTVASFVLVIPQLEGALGL